VNVTPPLVWALTRYLIADRGLIRESYDNEQTKAEIAAASHSFGLPWVWQPVSPAKYREKNLLGTIFQQTWDRAAAERL